MCSLPAISPKVRNVRDIRRDSPRAGCPLRPLPARSQRKKNPVSAAPLSKLSWRRDDWRGRAARLGTACQQAACLSLIERKFNEGTTALLPYNALPGLTLGEHANGPRAHSV